MNTPTLHSATPAFELRFQSLFNEGRDFTLPAVQPCAAALH